MQLQVLLILLTCLVGYSVSENDLIKGLREQSFVYNLAEIAEEVEDTPCTRHLRMVSKAVLKKDLWALKMLDASGTYNMGYLGGNTLWMGSMSQCRAISSEEVLNVKDPQVIPRQDHLPYDLHYAAVLLDHNNIMQSQTRSPINDYIHLGLCVPKSCKNEELNLLLSRVLNRTTLNFQQIYPVILNINKIKIPQLDISAFYDHPLALIATVFFSITIVLAIAGTIYDIKVYQPILKTKSKKHDNKDENSNRRSASPQPRSLSRGGEFLMCFSLQRNVGAIFDTSSAPSGDSLPVVHGLKSWGMFYIIVLHCIFFRTPVTTNMQGLLRLSSLVLNQIVINSSYSVDSYICLGGFLISYFFYKTHKDKKPYSLIEGTGMYVKRILHRYLRLTPAYAAALLAYFLTFQIVHRQFPIYNTMPIDQVHESCPKYWWRNFLYINTFFPAQEMCMAFTWYLSNDMIIYLMNYVLLIISTVYTKASLCVFYGLIAISMVSGAVTSYVNNYIPTFDELMQGLNVMYFPFWLRMGPYFVGVLFGYYMNVYNGKIPLTQSQIKKMNWAMVAMMLYVIHGVYGKNELSNLYIAVYMGLSRVLWGVGIAWLISICISGNGGVVNKFLSFSGWIPYSRVSYCVYLIHILIIYMMDQSGEYSIHMSYVLGANSAFGVVVLSFIIAVVFSALFELPSEHLVKMFTNSQSKPTKEKTA